MPVQKGKKRKRPRNRGPKYFEDEDSDGVVEERKPNRPPPAMGLFGRTPSLRANATLGAVMIILGLFFFASGFGGGSGSLRLLLLIGYLFIGGFYLSRAYRQYRARQEDSE